MPVTPDDLDGAMTIPELAARIHRSDDTVKRMIRNREIETLRIGSGRGRIVITQRAFLDYLNKARNRTA